MLKNITLVIIFLIIYGSLYPFDFRFQAISDTELSAFFQTWLSVMHKGDIIANILIFVPLGFVGAYSFSGSVPRIKKISIIFLLAILLGFGLQVLQLFLPSRDANLFDGVLNVAGTGLGLLSATILNISVNDKIRPFSISLPLLLVFSWLTYRLLPFVPALDWKEIKNSVKPLLLHTYLNPVGLWHDMVAWGVVLVFAERIFRSRHPQRDAGLLLLGCLFMEVLIVNNSISLSNVLGAAAGYGVWLLLRQFGKQIASLILVFLLSVYFILYSFVPFEPSNGNNNFSWIPFSGFLSDSMYHNTLAFIEKIFFYGSLAWLMLNMRLRAIYVGVLLASFLLLIEISQIFIGHHSPEITDPLFIIILVYFFAKVKREQATAFYGGLTDEVICPDMPVVLFIESKKYSGLTPPDGLVITKKPFYVGRTSYAHGKHLPRGRSLLLSDIQPYQLSRKHFRIDFKNGWPAVFDCNSTLGTIVNGITIGKKCASRWARLNPGGNSIIAGGLNSGIRFKVILSLAEREFKNGTEELKIGNAEYPLLINTVYQALHWQLDKSGKHLLINQVIPCIKPPKNKQPRRKRTRY